MKAARIKENYCRKNVCMIVINRSQLRKICITEKQNIIDLTSNSDASNPSKIPSMSEVIVSQVTKCIHQHHHHLLFELCKSLSDNSIGRHAAMNSPLTSELFLEETIQVHWSLAKKNRPRMNVIYKNKFQV